MRVSAVPAMWAGDGGGDVKVKVMACGRRDGKVQDGGFEAGGIQHHRWSKRAIGTTA